ncbi:nucleoside deaminase [Maribacter ulvicola]|uniref:tRNA(Arg) A34 adenosine deaminase TadA n=1 Tax=Maribacter ulvicola TaxID=228959 RepID=A0A1N7A3Q9_9FLAO|nr:nucleoside deaminase [Maribacter ulvicola]SIR33717.1 tRNA(Arg) A34 adenosine deaminase TadA [Maribacter ulvicola]
MKHDHEFFMRRAIEMASHGMNANAGGPFGAVIVKNGEIIAEGHNQVTSTNDPTAHAEMVVIRDACKKLNTFQLTDCIIYTSCEPCPMCFGAIYWARPKAVYYGCNKADAKAIDFDDQFIYDELEVEMKDRQIHFKQMLQEEAIEIFNNWASKNDKTQY